MNKKVDGRSRNNPQAGRNKLVAMMNVGRAQLNEENNDKDELIILPKSKKQVAETPVEPQTPQEKPKKEKANKMSILVEALNKLNDSQEKLRNKFKKQKERKLIKNQTKSQIKAIPQQSQRQQDPLINELRRNLLVKF